MIDRDSKSADEIASLIEASIEVVPGLASIRISIVRLSAPDATGCNWIARHDTPPPGCPVESVRLLKDIVAHARENFNLWEVH